MSMQTTNFLTLGDWMNGWMAVYMSFSVCPKTYTTYQSYIRLMLSTSYGNPTLDDIDELLLQKLMNELFLRNLSKSTLAKVRRLLRNGLQTAVRLGKMSASVNPAEHLNVPKNAPVKKVRALTVNEQMRVETACHTLPKGDVCIFMLRTGVRRMELIDLKWADYDAQKKCIYIRKSKTDAGIRMIPLSREALQIIERQPKCSEHIFVNIHGNPFTASSLYKLIIQIQKRSGVAIATNHVYRHTFASRLIEAGKDPKSVARLMGHTKVEMTVNIKYPHKFKVTVKVA